MLLSHFHDYLLWKSNWCVETSQRAEIHLEGEKEKLVERNLAYMHAFHLVRFLMWVCKKKSSLWVFFPLMSLKSNWRAWHQWRGTHSVWQCLPFIYLLCAMWALAPSSLLPSLWLTNPSSPLSLPPSPLRTYSPVLPPSPFSLYLPLSPTLPLCIPVTSIAPWVILVKTIIHTEKKHIQADSSALEKKISHFNYLSISFLNSHLLSVWICILWAQDRANTPPPLSPCESNSTLVLSALTYSLSHNS